MPTVEAGASLQLRGGSWWLSAHGISRRYLRRRGVLNIVHGTHDTVNRICDHPDIEAVSFVGSNAAGKYIYERATAAGKRCQASTAMIMSVLFASNIPSFSMAMG